MTAPRRVRLTVHGHTVDADVVIGSANGKSLMLQFEAILDGCVGTMPVLQHDDGRWTNVMTGTVIDVVEADDEAV